MKLKKRILLTFFILFIAFLFFGNSIEARRKKRQTVDQANESAPTGIQEEKVAPPPSESETPSPSEQGGSASSPLSDVGGSSSAVKHALQYGVSYFSDNITPVINSLIPNNYSTSLEGVAISMSYSRYFKKELFYIRTGIDYDISQSKYIESEGVGRKIKENRYGIPLTFGVKLGVPLASFYIDGGINLMNYRLLIDNSYIDPLGNSAYFAETYQSKGPFLNLGIGFIAHTGIMIQVNKKTRFYTEVSIMEGAIKANRGYSNVSPEPIPAYRLPEIAEVFINPRATRFYFGFINTWE